MIAKNFFLFLSNNSLAKKIASRHGFKLGASRFVAGENIEQVIVKVKELNASGMKTTLDFLGEFVSTEEEAEISLQNCLQTLEVIHHEHLNSSMSVKLTQLGLDISKDLCLQHMRTLLNVARKYNLFIQIDMEDYARNEVTLDVFKTLHDEYEGHVGTVIQAYLHKSRNDIEDLNGLNTSIRICKGAYKEDGLVSYREAKDIDKNYMELVKQRLNHEQHTGIATHDEKIVMELLDYISKNDLDADDFEFQMLYGIRPELGKYIVEQGMNLRIYIPFGEDWFGYFMRRLAERPKNIQFVWHSVFRNEK